MPTVSVPAVTVFSASGVQPASGSVELPLGVAEAAGSSTGAPQAAIDVAHRILDTDPLMTAVWADMLFGRRDPWFGAWQATADLYLLFDIDLPWIEDGTRMFGTAGARQRFFDLSKAELERRGVRWALISGDGEGRFRAALEAIEDAGLA